MEGEKGATVVLAARAPAAEEILECGCCGRRYAPKRIAMFLRCGAVPCGPICPECVLAGPRGARRRLIDRFRERVEEPEGASGLRKAERAGPYRVLTEVKAATLAESDSFPLAAREAAVRELREKR